MSHIEAMKQGLEVLEECRRDPRLKYEHPTIEKAITSLRQTIAEAEKKEQEPVAWRHDMGEENGGWEYFEQASCPECQPLYTSPPQRQPLTDEQIDQAIEQVENEVGGTTAAWDLVPPRNLVRSILKAAHGIKGEA